MSTVDFILVDNIYIPLLVCAKNISSIFASWDLSNDILVFKRAMMI